MRFEKGSKLFVRVDKVGEGEMTQKDFQDHLEYLNNIAKERYFLGGGFSNINGGMILCEALNIDEAKKIFYQDPIIEKKFYQCEVYEWDLVVLS